MPKFNFLSCKAPTAITPSDAIRTRATAKDRYQGLRAHDYIAVRQAEADATFAQTSAQQAHCSNKGQ
jgi:hypothetical protein